MSDDGVSKLACLAVPLAIFRVSNNELVDDATSNDYFILIGYLKGCYCCITLTIDIRCR